MRRMSEVLKLSFGTGWLLILCLLAVPGPAAAQFASPAVNGTIAAGEYGVHTDGQNQQTSGGATWFMTWDAANLYVGISGANVTEAAVLYLDKNPLAPINGGADVNGTLVGQSYDGTNFAALQFRADLVVYVKNTYREYRTADGANGWSGPTTGFGGLADNGSTVRELAIPWAAIGGQPASFAWFGYVTSGGGSVYGQVPTENAGGAIGGAARYGRYYTVSSTADGLSTAPFSRNSYVFNETADISGFGAISVYDFTMNSAGRTITRGSGAWTIGGSLRVDAGAVSFGAATSPAAVAGDVVIGTSGTLSLSTAAGGDLSAGGNWTKDGAFNVNSRTVTFNGSAPQTIGGSTLTVFHDLTLNNGSGVTLSQTQYVFRLLTLSSGDLNLGGKSLLIQSATAGGGIAASGARSITGGINSGVLFLGSAKTISGGTLTFGPSVNVSLYTGVDFGPAVSKINGALYLYSGGVVNTNPPVYGANSNLLYGSGGVYNRGLEWSAGSGPGYPYYVSVFQNTTLNYPNGSTAARSMAGGLTIQPGSTFDMGYGGPGLNNPLTVGGGVVIFGTLSLGDAPGGDLVLGGAWQNSTDAYGGAFNPNGRTVIFNGSGSQFIFGSAPTTFAGLTIANSSADSVGVWVGQAQTVTGVLTLTDGLLKAIQGYNLTLGPNASVSGGSTASMVVTDNDSLTTNDGFLCKVYAGAGSFTFPVGDIFGVTQYAPSTLAFSAGLDDPSTVCVRTTNARHPNWPGVDYPTYITRYWTATSTDNAFTGVASFTYDQADVVVGSGQTEAALHHKIWNGASWTGGAAADTGANLLSTPVSSFSDHTAFSASPLAVDLAHFTATAAAQGVTLGWETVSERDNAGFNVYRAESGSVGDRPQQESSGADPLRMTGWVRLNDALIAAAAPGSSEGHSYAFTDATAAQGATYWYALEDVALDGTLTRHAPVSVTVAQPNAVGLAGFGAAGYNSGWAGLYGLLSLAALAGAGWLRRRM